MLRQSRHQHRRAPVDINATFAGKGLRICRPEPDTRLQAQRGKGLPAVENVLTFLFFQLGEHVGKVPRCDWACTKAVRRLNEGLVPSKVRYEALPRKTAVAPVLMTRQYRIGNIQVQQARCRTCARPLPLLMRNAQVPTLDAAPLAHVGHTYICTNAPCVPTISSTRYQYAKTYRSPAYKGEDVMINCHGCII
ncbi:hypothetical protein CFAM422_004592 [Trichoderma lentiforme]|uniref:Uncharacterized protein n=1 Tax=Trichoderma lentiforme TaxID=1567552 RepID=A0A9P5CCM1_9HYPO|nr:hypothetical protein CFAM422_004592 [Trichoderma lentiforme]